MFQEQILLKKRVIVRSMVAIKHDRTNVLEQILVNQMWLTNAVMARVEDQMLLEYI
jgi:hypothetical protein